MCGRIKPLSVNSLLYRGSACIIKSRMKIKLSSALAALFILSICLMTACQPTPKEAVVINKGDNKLQKTIESASLAEPSTIAETSWNEDYNITGLECKINARITMPDTKKFPVYKVKQNIFDSNNTGKVIKYFTEDAVGVRKNTPTKEELEEQLVAAKRGTWMEDDNGGRWEPYEEQKQDIANFEEQIKNAKAETFDPVNSVPVILPLENVYKMKDGSKVYINARSRLLSFSKDNYYFLGITPESWLIEGDAYPGELPGTTLKNVKISEAEARTKATDLIRALGIENIGIARTEKALMLDAYTSEEISEGWEITLTRDDGNSIPVDLDSAQLNGMLDLGTGDFNDRWRQETISIFIDETGVRWFDWSDPLDVVDVMNPNVSLLPFGDIKERIKKSIEFGYSQRTQRKQVSGNHKISIENIILTNLLVPVKDDTDHQMLLPAWLVYYRSSSEVNGKEYKDRETVFAINAIDGSSIDLAMRMRVPEQRS